VRRPVRIAITTGDVDGIGTEVVAKSLLKLKAQKDVTFYLWRSPKTSKKDLQRIDRVFRRETVSSWHEALTLVPESGRSIVDICSNLSPAFWVEMSAKAALFGHIDGIATAPLSKTVIRDAGLSDVGHTDILSRISNRKDLFMTFIGSRFCVILATGHVALSEVSKTLSSGKLISAVHAAHELRTFLPKARARLPVALLALNPHAGEKMLIGNEEATIYKTALEVLRKSNLRVDGPLVPDIAFLRENQKKYCVYVCAYHDQGLIPFKAFHGHDKGVHITLGLPFVRTSVDHGTAKDIFGKDVADCGSMLESLKWAINLSRLKFLHKKEEIVS
jgi:4-hydroxythreonine-4-phosphate dehydrogenase